MSNYFYGARRRKFYSAFRISFRLKSFRPSFEARVEQNL
jgi:hypothetical protein